MDDVLWIIARHFPKRSLKCIDNTDIIIDYKSHQVYALQLKIHLQGNAHLFISRPDSNYMFHLNEIISYS